MTKKLSSDSIRNVIMNAAANHIIDNHIIDNRIKEVFSFFTNEREFLYLINSLKRNGYSVPRDLANIKKAHAVALDIFLDEHGKIGDLGKIKNEMDRNLIPDKYFNWIEPSNDLQNYWFWLSVISMFYGEGITLNTPIDSKEAYAIAIDHLDKWNDSIHDSKKNGFRTSDDGYAWSTEGRSFIHQSIGVDSRLITKVSTIKELKNLWYEIASSKNTTPWFSSDDTEQIEYIWDYIRENYSKSFKLNASTDKQKYLAISAMLELPINKSGEKLEFIAKMNNAWKTKHRRDQEKAGAIFLDNKAQKELNALVKSTGMNPKKVLEQLIKKEKNE